ncbi:MAG TPA: hypothetical protein DCP11_15815 [Microbacteriaceae bacterium]|jgi:hypothetical protein|nr:hypothetical protein [Microbacteriaceae bacterium]
MNLHERGKKLSKAVTGAIGLIAIVTASALGLHTWADVQATKAASQNSAATTVVSPSTDDGSSNTDSGNEVSDEQGSDDDGSSSSSVNSVQSPLVSPSNGGPSQATTSGS